MKKARMITRTIKSTLVSVKEFNTETSEITDVILTLSGDYDNSKDLEKDVREIYDSESTRKFIMINTSIVQEKLYGMEESLFLEYAKELPPRGNGTED